MSLLQVNNLGKSYNSETKVLKDVNFSVEAGEFVSIIGPSGAGKSTLLRCINRMVEINEGKVIFNNLDVGSLKKKTCGNCVRISGWYSSIITWYRV